MYFIRVLSASRMPNTTTPKQTPGSVSVSFDCPSELAARLADLAKSSGVTLPALVASLVVTPIQDQLADLS